MAKQTRKFEINVHCRKAQHTDDRDLCDEPAYRDAVAGQRPGSETQPLSSTLETIEVTVNWEEIARTLGLKAAYSTRGQASVLKGLIVVKHVRADNMKDEDR